jgi:hypothetical protein
MKINPFTCVVAGCAVLAVTLLAQEPGQRRVILHSDPDASFLTPASFRTALHSFEAERKWQYKIVAPGANLDVLGKEGWELVAVVSADREQSLYFKKPLPPGQAPESPK